jgi:NAD(P)-dependent dehydrogenase (short-subunit alcohol dehydrogenase family)
VRARLEWAGLASIAGHEAIAGFSHYAASKAALEHLTRCWALELAPRGIRVNAVAAGPAETAALVEMMDLSPEQAEGVKERERKIRGGYLTLRNG